MGAIQQVITSLKPASGGSPTYYYSFTQGTGGTGGSGDIFKFYSPCGPRISAVPAGTITKVGIYINNVNAGAGVHAALLTSAAVPVGYLGVIIVLSTGWNEITCSEPWAGGDLNLNFILDPGAPYDGAVSAEWKAIGNGAEGANSYSAGWPIGNPFSIVNPNGLCARVELTP